MVQKMHILNFNVMISINIHHHDFRLSCHAHKVFLSTRPSQILIYVFNINMSLFYLFKSLINQEFILLKGKRQQSVLVLFSKWLAVYLFPTALEDACLLCVDFSHIWDLLLDPLSCRTDSPVHSALVLFHSVAQALSRFTAWWDTHPELLFSVQGFPHHSEFHHEEFLKELH